MKKVKKLFGGIDLNWKKLIIFAIIAGVYTAIMAMLPITKNTSFADIAISFEVWILFGILIIMNSKSAKDSALKCFIFFLISQPLVYLTQDIINHSKLFDDSYKVYLEDDKLGRVHIEYDESLEDYKVDAEFKRAGITNLVLEDSNGNKTIYEIDVKRNTYNITKK